MAEINSNILSLNRWANNISPFSEEKVYEVRIYSSYKNAMHIIVPTIYQSTLVDNHLFMMVDGPFTYGPIVQFVLI